MSLLTKLKETFNYQIDLVIPNYETNFGNLIENVLKKYEYFLLTKVSLSELLDPKFIEKFIKNGKVYLFSYDTQLDSHDCVALLPNGNLVLSLTSDTYLRVPVTFLKQTSKTVGYTKYEINLSLTEIEKNIKSNCFNTLKNSFEGFLFSFFVYWEPNDTKLNVKSELETYFGIKRVLKCLNRLDTKVVECDSNIVEEILELVNQISLENKIENYTHIENLIGCLDHQINLEKFSSYSNSIKSKNEKGKVSIIKWKGFMPNSLLDVIFVEYLRPLMAESLEIKGVFMKIHGFRDSPSCLFDMQKNTKIRINEENFLSIYFQSLDEHEDKELCYFTDFKRTYFIK